MKDIVSETQAFVVAALDGDPAISSLEIVGSFPVTISASIDAGLPPSTFGGMTYKPAPPFRREVLVELVVRMQQKRWSRFDDFVLGMSPHPEDWWQSVRTQLGVSPEFGPGWADMISAAGHWIRETGGDTATSQIKEKFGTLRWYHSRLTGDLGDEIIEAAEHLSGFICEKCGALGHRFNPRGWVKTVCSEHENA